MSQIRNQTSLGSVSYFRFSHLEYIRPWLSQSWILGVCICVWFFWRNLLLINPSLNHALHTSCCCTRSLMFKRHVNAFIPSTLFTFVLLIECLRLSFWFFRADHLFMPLVNEGSVVAFPLWEEFFYFFLS